MLAVDPVLQMIVRAALSLLFAAAAGHKLRDVTGFRAALAHYKVLPARWVGPSAVTLIGVEISVAAALWVPAFGALAGLAAAALLAVYAGAIGLNLRRGRRDIDCGCAGVAGERPLSGALVLRNAILLVAAVLSALPAVTRPLTWLDAMTVIAGVAALALLYPAVDTVWANAPKIAALVSERTVQRTPRVPSGDQHA